MAERHDPNQLVGAAPDVAPLAWVIIGGLVSSTMLARVVTPVLYKLVAPRVEGVGAARSEGAGAFEGAAEEKIPVNPAWRAEPEAAV